MSGELGQFYGCWCPGSLHRQDITSHAIGSATEWHSYSTSVDTCQLRTPYITTEQYFDKTRKINSTDGRKRFSTFLHPMLQSSYHDFELDKHDSFWSTLIAKIGWPEMSGVRFCTRSCPLCHYDYPIELWWIELGCSEETCQIWKLFRDDSYWHPIVLFLIFVWSLLAKPEYSRKIMSIRWLKISWLLEY